MGALTALEPDLDTGRLAAGPVMVLFLSSGCRACPPLIDSINEVWAERDDPPGDQPLVVAVHDGEPDHVARRSWRALPYLGTQRERVRAGTEAVAGNHVGVALPGGRAFVFLVHLRRGSIRVRVGDLVHAGQVLGTCGNSGNSTQPHVHLQVTDGPAVSKARGVPVEFRGFREQPVRGPVVERVQGVPAEGSIVERLD